MSGAVQLESSLRPDSHEGALEAQALVKTYRQRGLSRRMIMAVEDVSLSLAPRQTIAVVGESGSGKSTLARLLLNLEHPDRGTVRFDGKTVSSLSGADLRAYRRAAQMVFQHPQQSFNPMLTIGSSVRDALRLRDDLSRAEKDRMVPELLSLVGLDPSLGQRRRRELSGGELQRAALARALASQPRFLVLDEPTSALDASIRGQIIELLLRFQDEQDMGYVLVTHDMRLVQMMAEYVLVMYLGQIVEEGPTEAILQRPLHPYTRSLIAAAALEGDNVRGVAHGELSELPDGYEGCRFAPRCAFAADGCQRPQRLLRGRPRQQVRCWRWETVEAESGSETADDH